MGQAINYVDREPQIANTPTRSSYRTRYILPTETPRMDRLQDCLLMAYRICWGQIVFHFHSEGQAPWGMLRGDMYPD